MSKVEVIVAATSVESGRFRPAERTVDLDSLLSLFDRLADIGQGYLELRSTGQEFPVVTVGFRGSCAVIHCAYTPTELALLHGDGSVPPREPVEVPIMNDLATFTGEFVLDMTHARTALKKFATNGNPATLGKWNHL